MSIEKPVFGWREWAGLPDLRVQRIRAKLDTGARTASLHATDISEFGDSGRRRVHFVVHPGRSHAQPRIECRADVVDERFVTDSGGHRERRLIIMTNLAMGGRSWLIELSLTDRRNMRFELLLGRSALVHRCLIDPTGSYRAGHPEDEETAL